MYAELANAPVRAVTHHPSSLSWAEAATVWMQYVTAYGALIDIAGLKSGDTLLIPAASSSVGLAAIQIANKVKAVPVALTRGSSKRLERAKQFINDGLADGSFKPLIAKTFPLDQIVDAHRYLESNQQIGKVVVTV
jgi:NADPH:quinone reductase-like Zn-dependent oxidoreductase